jgi:hypothetical protein
VFVIYSLATGVRTSNTLSYEYRFEVYEQKALEISKITCGQSVSLGYYPGEPFIYFFTGMSPVSRYIYFWPWVSEIGLADVVKSLKSGKSIVYVDRISIWGYPVVSYLKDLLDYLDKNYVLVNGYYLSPDLYSLCGYAEVH